MSFFDQFDNIKYQLNRFLWPAIFLIAGLFLLKMGAVPKELELHNGETLMVEQDSWFLYASVFFIIGAAVWILYLLGMIKTMIGYGVMGIMALLGFYILWKDYNTIKVDVDYKNRWEMMDRDIKARMLDLKEAELAYKEFHDKYTNNIDDLIDFVKNGKKMKIKKVGSVPERRITPEERDYIYGDDRPIDKLMTEEEAYILVKSPNPPADLAGFERDTSYIPVLDAIFHDPKYIENRAKSECDLAFHPDSLKYIPYTTEQVAIDTAFVMKGDIRVSTLQIVMGHPMDAKQLYQIGDINDNHLRESWKK